MINTIIIALILCMIEFLVIVIASPMAKPSLVLRFLPKDIREAAKDHPAPPVYKQIIAHVLLAVFLIIMILGVLYVGIDGIRNGLGYWQLTARYIVLLYVMKAFDIIVQDQWLVMTVSALTLPEEEYDLATAFETIYFWPGLKECFSQVAKVLKPCGTFMIVNESDGTDETSLKFEKIIDGMKCHTVEDALKSAGFSKVKSDHHNSKPWITVIARK